MHPRSTHRHHIVERRSLTRGVHMALSERIQEPPPASLHGHPCSVGKLLADLPPSEAEALNVMLTGTPQRRWSQTEIYDAVTAEGHTIGLQSINRHRAGRCRCFPS